MTVRRIAGGNRYATAPAIAAELPGSGHALVARGDGFADVLSASGLGSATSTPIVLVEPQRMPDETATALSDDLDVTVVGGTAALCDVVVATIGARVAAVRRLGGETRYATSAAVADPALAATISPAVTWVATGADFPDALVAGAAAGRDHGVLLLVDGHDLATSPEPRDWLATDRDTITAIRIAGGTAAVTSGVEAAVSQLVGPPR